MGNVSGNATAADTPQVVLNGSLLAIAIIGLGLAFVRILWSRFRSTDGEQLSVLGKQVVTSTAAVMTVAFVVALLVGASPDPNKPLDPSYLSFGIMSVIGFFIVFGLWFWYSAFYSIWHAFKRRIGQGRLSSESVKAYQNKSASLVAWASVTGGLVMSVVCGILALLVLSGQAVGLNFSKTLVDWGVWLSWSGVLVFAINVVLSGMGFFFNLMDLWPLRKRKYKK